MALTKIFEGNAAELRALEAEVHRTYEKRLEIAWREACERFHARYDRLAFPGGLAKAMSLLAANDPNTIETAVRFLEADPWFFRSGYIKADILRQLRRAPLNNDQRDRLRQAILTRIRGEDRREFRWWCRLAPYVTDPEFERSITDLTLSSVELVSRHARWALEHLKPFSHQPRAHTERRSAMSQAAHSLKDSTPGLGPAGYSRQLSLQVRVGV